MHFSDVQIRTLGEPYGDSVDILPNLRTTLRVYGKCFTYKHTHDKQGIIYWLGTLKGTTDTFSNLETNNMVRVQYKNANEYNSQPIFANYETGYMQLNSVLPHNVKIILNFSPANIRIKMDKYTLGYYSGGNGDCILRNWRLLGSNDGTKWTLLKEHVNDTSITVQHAASWDINCYDFFSHFCIERTGDVTGAQGSQQCYTAASGLEIYGTVIGKLNL
jgi:hypothetical protein